VGNLAFSTTEEEVAQFFHNTESVRLGFDKATNAPKGFCYVTFPTRDDLANAFKKDGEMLGSRTVKLDTAQDRGGSKGKGSGGFGDGSGGFSSFAGGGRDFMGTGQIERGEAGGGGQKGDGGKGGRGGAGMGGFGGGGGAAWDKGRDAMGSGVQEDRKAPRTGPLSFSRDTMGSEQNAASEARPAFGARGPGKSFGGDSEGWSAGRDAMGTGTVEERRAAPGRPEAPVFSRDTMAQEQPPLRDGDAPRPPRAGPSRPMFGSSDTALSRDMFGAGGVPEKPAAPPPRAATTPWRPSAGRAAAAAAPAAAAPSHAVVEADWRSGGASDHKDSPAKDKWARDAPAEGERGTKFQPKLRQTNTELEAKKERPPPKVPVTQEELFQQQVAKTKQREQQQKAAKAKGPDQALNPFQALGKTKKKKTKKDPKKKGEEGEGEGEEAEGGDAEEGAAEAEGPDPLDG
jgi:hypothetical protein